MDDENASCAHDGEEDTQLSLLHLPVEIFLHICSFLDTPTLVHSLSLVCKQFYLILKNDSLWKARINRIWPHASESLLRPARPDKLFWMSSCVAIEKQAALWKQQDSMEKLIDIYLPDYEIRALLLMHDGTTCVAGDTNGNVICWILPSNEELPFNEIRNKVRIDSMHDNKLISDLTAIDNTIYSCSYRENVIQSWMLTNTSLVRQTTYETDELYDLVRMSSCPERALFATCSYNDIIYVFDSRASIKPIMRYRPHTEAVTGLLRSGLAMNTEYILSAHGNNTMSVWDQRTGRILKSITIPDKSFLACMSMQRDWVCVGDSNARLHMLDSKNDFELVKSYSTEHKDELTGVRMTHGCLMITSSRDGTVRISSTTDPPQPIATLLSDFGEITSMDYLNDTLAIFDDNNVAVWRLKKTYSTKY